MTAMNRSGWMELDRYPQIIAFVAGLKELYDAIRAEVTKATSSFETLECYNPGAGWVDEKWRSISLIRGGRVTEQVAKFSVTWAFLAQNAKHLLYPTGDVMFSILAPGCHIPKHSDTAKFWVTLGYGVLVPSGCGLAVEDDSREFREGEAYLFDQNSRHEAWNRSSQVRINLLMDIWHPDIALSERGRREDS
jgi:hypothetical protein